MRCEKLNASRQDKVEQSPGCSTIVAALRGQAVIFTIYRICKTLLEYIYHSVLDIR